MAHSKSALKRWRQSLARRDRNRSTKSRTRTLLNKALSVIGQEGAEDAVKAAVSALDKAALQGVIHANAAARGKSRLLKRFNFATASAIAAQAAAAAAAEAPPAKAPRRRTAKPEAEEKAPAKRAPRTRASAAKAPEEPAAEKAPRSRTRKTT